MRFLLLSMMITAALLSAGIAQAQAPVMLENPEATPAPIIMLPDITPDVIDRSTPAYQAPNLSAEEGQSIIAPSLEPWQKAPRKKYRGKNADDIFLTLPYDIQSLILDETYSVNAECHQYSTYAQFHDCECLGSRYFEERVFNPEDNKDSIVGRISGECASIGGVAGYGYDQCLSGMRYVLVAARTEDYCTCFANKLAENYVQSPSPDYDNLRALSSRTNTYCLQKVKSSVKPVP